MNKSAKATAMLLEANFDIDQVGTTLEWRFSRRDGDGNPIKGKYAGSIYFTIGEKMRVHITGGSAKPFMGFQVLDCCLITRPMIFSTGPDVPTTYAPPSPFIANGAVPVFGASVRLPPDQFVRTDFVHAASDASAQETAHDNGRGYFEVAQKWDGHLRVADFTGRWELSFVLTVRITRADGTSFDRVFDFDPEGEVGNGITPNIEMSGPGFQFLEDEDIGGRLALRGIPSHSLLLMPEGEVGNGATPDKV